ncbi:MAG: NfeD family protein [Gammaproteobacteria bacterium]|nr:NfeD family protein [Gammaproteobacteria bacterium]MCP5459909.1 NfeD family protein [Gammaproteobacteria bacterium]
MELFTDPAYWHWWLLGLALIVIEILAPGTFVLWMGIGALGVGLLVFLFPGLPWQAQWLLFAGLTIASILAWLLYFRKRSDHSDDPLLNRRGQQYVGRVFALEQPIVNGYGKIRVDDSVWKIEADDCPAGTKVRIVGVDGVMLKGVVERGG